MEGVGKRKQILTALLAGTLAVSGLTACGGSKEKEDASTIHITSGGQAWWGNMIAGLEAKFPELNFEYEDYTGPNHSQYIHTLLEHEDFGDIYVGTYKISDEECKAHLMDMSGYGFVGNYEESILNQ